jgi:hypothetical protein
VARFFFSIIVLGFLLLFQEKLIISCVLRNLTANKYIVHYTHVSVIGVCVCMLDFACACVSVCLCIRGWGGLR